LSVLAGLNKFFKNTDSVIHVHDFLLHFGCPEGARVWRNSAHEMPTKLARKAILL
jgi:hypothetical protein